MEELFKKLNELNFNNLLEDGILYRNKDIVIFANNNRTTYVPYPSINRQDGSINHGYKNLKNEPDLINNLPELQNSETYKNFIIYLNDKELPFETIGCEHHLSNNNHEVVKYSQGSYTQIIFSDYEKNKNFHNFYVTLNYIINSIKDCHLHWGNLEVGIEPLKGLYDFNGTYYCLLIRVVGYGRTSEEAIMHWETTLNKIRII